MVARTGKVGKCAVGLLSALRFHIATDRAYFFNFRWQVERNLVNYLSELKITGLDSDYWLAEFQKCAVDVPDNFLSISPIQAKSRLEEDQVLEETLNADIQQVLQKYSSLEQNPTESDMLAHLTGDWYMPRDEQLKITSESCCDPMVITAFHQDIQR
jgi:hypothetical protein